MSNLDSITLTRSNDLQHSREETGIETFVRSAIYSGVQIPITGAAQLADKLTGKNVLPSVQFIDAPRENSFAAGLGSVTATAGHCALMIGLGHKIAGPVTDVSSFANRALVTGALGSFYGGVLTPVQTKNGDFVGNRLKNMITGTAGLAGMSAFTSVYKDIIGQGVSFIDAPFYKGLLVPGSLAGLATMADTQLFPRYENSVFLPGSKLRPAEEFSLQPKKDR